MMVNYDLQARSGLWSSSSIFVKNELTDLIVYEGPEANWCGANGGCALRRTGPSAPKKRGPLTEATATGDLEGLMAAGLLEAHRENRSRFHTGTSFLQAMRHMVGADRDARDDADLFA